MRVALERLDGVESVTVSLEEGEALIRFAEQHEVTLAIVRQVVRDNGFSPKQTELRAAGTTVVLPGGELGVELDDVGYRLQLRPGGEVPDQADLAPGLRVVVSGVVPEPEDGSQPAIEVTAFTVIDRSRPSERGSFADVASTPATWIRSGSGSRSEPVRGKCGSSS